MNPPSFHEECIPSAIEAKTEEKRIDNQSYIDQDCTRDLSSCEYYECVFTRVTFQGAMDKMELVDVIFDHCDLSNIKMRECSFRRVIFKYCRLTGCDMSGSSFRDTEFSFCRGWYINFNDSRFHSSSFSECIFTEGTFSMMKSKDLNIENCDFSGTEWLETKMKDLDFSDSIIGGIMVSPECLKGIIVNPDQAVSMAKLLGIQVK